MPNLFIFTDEAGCFTFNRQPNVSRYFILCSVMMGSCEVGNALLALRRHLAWSGLPLGEYFHATKDKQSIRDAVFKEISQHDFSIQATIMEKSKAAPHLRVTKPKFYQFGYHNHFKFGVSRYLNEHSEALVTTASLGTRKEKAAFEEAVSSVIKQTNRSRAYRTDFMPCHADPCLQVADYCAWAIQRKWEKNDLRSYDIIRERISYENELWHRDLTHHY